MLEILRPKGQANSVLGLSLEELKEAGIRGLIFDLDNTLVEWNQSSLTPETIDLICRLKDNGFRICILSNALTERVAIVAGTLDIPYVSRAAKPRKSPFKKALDLLGTIPQETAVIGDQLFTDILGGNRMELYTIWTTPLSTTELISTKMVRRLERLIVKRFRRKGILK
jgi:HAD superfamily phosphatase (TIGR01668 family)